jgi:hypothetical protein
MTDSPTSISLDELMDRDPLSLSAQDIDAIIHFQRQSRANYEAGIKPEKADKGPKIKIDIAELGLKKEYKGPSFGGAKW